MKRSVVVHQFTVSLSGRDAVGHHTLQVDDILRELGAETTLYAEHIDPQLSHRAQHYREHATDPAPDLIIYQASIGSPVADYLLARPEPIVINYHNITPAELYYRYVPQLGAALDLGRQQLTPLCRKAIHAIADSEFNAHELRALGLRDVAVLPPLVDASVLPSNGEINPTCGRSLGTMPATLLFVGRLAPNKRQEDLIAATAILRRWIGDIELILVGSSSADTYARALKEYSQRLGVDDIVRFEGSVSSKQLVGRYQSADVFVCLSIHEGFCMPLVEAMAWGVPIVALGATAVPDTLGGAGVLVSESSPTLVATAIERVLTDQTLRQELSDRGLARAAELSPGPTRQRLRRSVEALIAGEASPQ